MTASPIPSTDPPDYVREIPDYLPDTIATPEGDNEYGPDQPLPPGSEPAIERPRGNEPHWKQPLRKALD